MAKVWIGSSAIHEQPGSPRITATGQGFKITRTFRGPFSALVESQPGLGQTVAGSVAKVESVEIVPDGAGTSGPGTMTIVLADDQITYEIDAATLEKPLEKHPIYNGGARDLSDDDLDKVAQWKAANTSAERAAVAATLSANAQHFVAKLRRGQESYVVAAPVARKTSRSFIKPATSAIGQRGAPGGFPDLPAGYQWLKTADRAVKQGAHASWERVEEWTAADQWDADIYPA